jgi:hypothetical protein
MHLSFGRGFGRDERGQATFESVIFAPIMVVALMATVWASREIVVKTRAAQAVRYGGLVQDHYGLPYEEWSYFTMYRTSSGRVWTDSTQCLPPPNAVMFGDPSGVGGSRPKFWTPQTYSGTTYVAGSCNNNTGDDGRIAYTGSAHFTRDLLGFHDQQIMIAGIPAPMFIPHDAANTSRMTATANFFRSPDDGTLIWCLTGMDAAVSPSLVPTWYSMNQTAPTPMPVTVTSTPPPVDSTCNGDQYIGTATTTNGVTPPTPFPYATPTPIPTWGPQGTPPPAATPEPPPAPGTPAPGLGSGGTTST